MKKILYLLLTVYLFSCESSFDGEEMESISNENLSNKEFSGENFRINSTGCGGFFGDFATRLNTMVTYQQDLNITDLAVGQYFTVTFVAKDLPNQFKIFSGTNLIYTSQWLGYSSFPGIWGSATSVNGPSSHTETIQKIYSGPYRVEVIGQTAPDSSYSPSTDNWEVWVSCGSDGTIPEPPQPPGSCPNCYQFLYDEFLPINQTNIYLETFNFSCIPIGKRIGFNLDVQDIPNKFQILKDGQPISDPNAVSPWLGTANYPGQWGMSLSANGTYTITTIREAGAVYTLQVLTQTPPDNVSYSPTTDYWSAILFCGD